LCLQFHGCVSTVGSRCLLYDHSNLSLYPCACVRPRMRQPSTPCRVCARKFCPTVPRLPSCLVGVCVCVCPGPSVAHRAPSHDGPGGARGSSRGRGGGAALPAGTLGSHTYPSCSTVEWFCTGAAFQTSLGSCPFFRVAIQPLPLVMHCLYSCLVLGRALELEGVLRSALYRAVWVSMCRELLASSRARAPG
jgi:hypothetical protein